MSITPDAVLSFALIAFSIILHEIAHGYAALKFGDETALRMDRLTVNPIVHVDPFGTLLLPIFQLFAWHAVYIGWAKPVPVNPRNLEPRIAGEIVVSIAGVAVNLAIALAIAVLLGFPGIPRPEPFVARPFLWSALETTQVANVGLALFNLLPIPPLDGSHVVKYLLPADLRDGYERIGFNGIFIILALNYLGWLDPIIEGPLRAITHFLYYGITVRLRGHA
ncbi:MAG TPA: site-2 protease family protein [Planctomycetota bacterium]|nr:site-2 protease family protein [Planctomycetota bacterium]